MALTRTLGDRIRHARTENGLSQAELARAVARITRNKISKSLVSAWETGKIQNPQNATLLAVQAVTGFRLDWLVTGKGAERAAVGELPPFPASGIDMDKLEKAIAAAVPLGGDPVATARASIALYHMLMESPDLKAPALSRLAVLFKAA